MSFETLLKLIPEYLDQLLKLISGAKPFFSDIDLAATSSRKTALIFFFNTVFLAFALKVPFVGEAESYWQTAMSTVVLCTFATVIFSLTAFICCKVMGGIAPLLSHVTIMCYFSAMSVLIYSIFSGVAKGIVKSNLPDEYENYLEYVNLLIAGSREIEVAKYLAIANSNTTYTSLLVLIVGISLILLWLIVIWRVLATTNMLNSVRGLAALFLFLIVGYGASYAVGLLQAAVGLKQF
ncbi:MAG: hypothetical protein V7784_24245 [Oceanospirillaceae bacterium]